MRKLYFVFLALVLSILSFAAPKTAVKNGNWNADSTWSPIGVPTSGDQVIIPMGKTVTVSNNNKYSNSPLNIDVSGNLYFINAGKLDLIKGSVVKVYQSGAITSNGSNSVTISINNVEVYSGPLGTIAGPVLADGTQVNTGGGGAAGSTAPSTGGFRAMSLSSLPVTFVSFSLATASNNVVLVQWATSEEINALAYEIERSPDGSSWTTVGKVAAVGNSTQLTTYSFSDRNSGSSAAYYRIKQVDLDGRFTYTAIKSIKGIRKDATVSILAFQNKVAVQFGQAVKGQVELQLMTTGGQLVARQVVSQPAGQVIFAPPVSLKGAYVVVVSNEGSRTARQVVL